MEEEGGRRTGRKGSSLRVGRGRRGKSDESIGERLHRQHHEKEQRSKRSTTTGEGEEEEESQTPVEKGIETEDPGTLQSEEEEGGRKDDGGTRLTVDRSSSRFKTNRHDDSEESGDEEISTGTETTAFQSGRRQVVEAAVALGRRGEGAALAARERSARERAARERSARERAARTRAAEVAVVATEEAFSNESIAERVRRHHQPPPHQANIVPTIKQETSRDPTVSGRRKRLARRGGTPRKKVFQMCREKR